MPTTNISLLEQTGGYKSLQIATLDEVTFCPDIVTNSNASSVEIVGYFNTLDVLPVPESFNCQVFPKRSASGILYPIKIQFDFPYQSSDLDNFLEAFNFKKVVVVGIKTQGTEKLFGSKNHPLTFDYEFIDGKRMEDGSITRITISANIPQKPVFIKD